jgi:large repetitive protein
VVNLVRDSSGLYLLPSPAGDGSAMFFVFDDESRNDANIDVATEFVALSGRFAFIATLPPAADRPTLAKAARTQMALVAGARIGWFAAGTGTFRLLHAVVVTKSGGSVKTIRQSISFKDNFELAADKDLVVSFSDADGFRIANKNKAIRILTESGSVPASTDLLIGFDGAAAGRFTFDLPANEAALEQLDIGLRLFEDVSVAIASTRFPLIDAAAAPVTLSGSVDPLDVEAQETPAGLNGTFLSFAKGMAVPTYYRTAHGHSVSLVAGDDARLHFCSRVNHVDGTSRTFYLAPSGTFAVQAGTTTQHKMLAGATGTEYFHVDTGVKVRFEPGQPALAVKTSSSDGPFLTNRATTSWMIVDPAASATYVGQPENAPLFAGTSLLSLHEHEPRIVDTALALPLLPLGGVLDEDAQKAHDLEAQAAARERRRLAAGFSLSTPMVALAADALSGTRAATTPQGLIRQFDEAGPEHLLVATSPGEAELAFRDLKEKFKNAIARDRLFLVLSRNTALGFGQFSSKLSIAGWKFDVKIDASMSGALGEQAIFIFKFDDRPLQDLIKHPELWAEGEEFNADTAAVSRFLSDYFNEALTSGRPEFRRILRALTDPKWNGVLAVNALVQNLAPGAESLTAGIKKTLRAHHVAMEINDVSGALALQESSFFALIDYNDPMLAPSGDFVFHVEQLRVLFENSKITDFSCRAKLFTSTLFDEPLPQPQTFVLLGHYESHAGKETYSFVAEGTVKLDVNAELVKVVTIDRVQLITVASDAAKIDSQFLLTGSVTFGDVTGKIGIDFFSFDALHFDKLGVDMHFDRTSGTQTITFNPGNIGLDTTLNIERAAGLLRNFPLKLKRFQRRGDGLKLPDLGFIQFVSHIGANCKIAKYGLFFELDLGSLGALASSAKDFKAEFVFAWCEDSLFGGIKLPESRGGPRSLGLEGVVQILIDDFAFVSFPSADGKSQIFALVLRGCAIEVLGTRFPSGDRPDIYLFINPNEISNGSNASLGWLMNFPDGGSLGPFTIERFVLGQRVGPSLVPKTVTGALDEIAKLPSTKDHVDFDLFKTKLANLFHPDRGWLIGSRMSISDTLTFGFIFNDPVLYGALFHLKKPTDFSIEITYRKITEDIGVYHAEITLPDSIRQWEFGAVSITVPSIGISVYTNGDFLLDVGYPYNFDFSRSCTVQVFPFIGGGGFYFGRLRGETSTALPFPNLNPVLEIGFGMRIGLGKEISKGILKAGLSVTFYGLLEGAVGYLPGTPWTEPSDYLVQGRMGVIGQIYGVVDFGIVKAGVAVTILLGFGIQLGSRVNTELWIEGRVSVQVEVVIGRIRIWRITIEIKVSFSFEMQVRYTWTLERKSQAAIAGHALALPPAPIGWDLPTPPAKRIPIALYFAPEVTMRDGKPRVVGGLLIECAERGKSAAQTAFDALVDELVRWAVLLHVGTAGGSDPDITQEDLKALDERLHLPPSLARTKGVTPLDYATLAAFVAQTFDVTVQGVDKIDAATFFPIIPDTALVSTIDGTPDQRRNLWQINPRDEQYQQRLSDYFNTLVVNRDEPATPGTSSANPPSLAQIVFQDYFEFIVKAGVDLLWRHMGTNDIASEKLGKLLADVAFDDVAGMAARFFKQGLRVPVQFASALPPVEALYELTGQQIAVPPSSAIVNDFIVALEERPSIPTRWFKLASNPAPRAELDKASFFANIGGVVIAPDVTEIRELDPIRVDKRRFALRSFIPWMNGADDSLVWPFPEALVRELRSAKSLPLEMITDRSDKPFQRDPKPLGGDYRFATRVELTARRIASRELGKFVSNAYALGGASERNRHDLDALIEAITNPNDVEIRIAYRGAGEGTLVSPPIDPKKVLLFRGNYSTETNPPAELFATRVAAVATEPDRASLDNPIAFLTLVQQCSLVNSGGYILRYGDSGLPDAIFESGSQKDVTANISLIVTSGSSVGQPARLHHNAVTMKKAVFDPAGGRVFFAAAATLPDASTVIEPGCVAFELLRTNPESVANPWSRDFELLYNLLEYRVPDQTGFKQSPESLPITPSHDDAVGTAQPVWHYRDVIPLHALARGGSGHYTSVGSQATVQFDFRDCFGNKLNFAGAKSRTAFMLRYFDKLVPLGSWPALAASYVVRAASGGAAEIALTLTFDAARLQDKTAEERDDVRARYERIAEQLDGPGVTIRVASSLRENDDHVLTAAQRSDLKAFLGTVIAHLKSGTVAPAPRVIVVPVSKTTIKNEKRAMFELNVAFTIARHAALIHAAAKVNDPDVVSVSTPVLPPDEDLAKNRSLATFAAALESAIPAIRVAVGTPIDGGSGIWAVRIGTNGAIAFTPDSAAIVYYAVPPITTERIQGDVDFDVLGRRFVEAVDWFLGPELGPQAARLDGASFDEVASRKRSLAGSISTELTPLLQKDETSDASLLDETRENFRQKLLINLATAYKVDLAAAMPVKVTTPIAASPRAPKLYGKVEASSTTADPLPQLAITPSKVVLGVNANSRPPLSFLLDIEAERAASSLPLKLQYTVSHLEYFVDDDKFSRWLKFVRPIETALGSPVVPIPLRQYPLDPRIQHRWLPGGKSTGTPVRAARAWTYDLTYSSQGVAQDTQFIEIELNVGENALRAFDATETLMDALAAFDNAYTVLGPKLRDLAANGAGDVTAFSEFLKLVIRVDEAWQRHSGAQLFAVSSFGSARSRTLGYQVTEQALSATELQIVLERDDASSPFPAAVEVEKWQQKSMNVNGNVATFRLAPKILTDIKLGDDRTLVFDAYDVLREENAWSSVQLRRNFKLANQLTRLPFVYSTPRVRASEPVVALLSTDTAVDVTKLGGTAKKKLREHLNMLFAALFEAVPSPGVRRIKVETRYGFDLRRRPGLLSANEIVARHPLYLVTPAEIEVPPNNDWSQEVVLLPMLEEAVLGWTKDHQPFNGGSLVFDLTVYAAASSMSLPVLRLSNIQLPLSAIS